MFSNIFLIFVTICSTCRWSPQRPSSCWRLGDRPKPYRLAPRRRTEFVAGTWAGWLPRALAYRRWHPLARGAFGNLVVLELGRWRSLKYWRCVCKFRQGVWEVKIYGVYVWFSHCNRIVDLNFLGVLLLFLNPVEVDGVVCFAVVNQALSSTRFLCVFGSTEVNGSAFFMKHGLFIENSPCLAL